MELRRRTSGDEIGDGEIGFMATPEITGIFEAKMARATISSLKDHKSSMEPPRARRGNQHVHDFLV